MPINQRPLAIVCILLIAVGGCSRQQSDWQKTREANTSDAYEQFLRKYPSGEFNAQAQARLKEMYEERDWQKARDADTPEAYQAFLKQYPEGKWAEEARIRVENFTLAQAPGTAGSLSGAAGPAAAGSGRAAEAGSAVEAGSAQGAPSGPAAQRSSAPPPGTAPRQGGPQHVAAKSQAQVRSAESGKFAVQLGAFKSGREAAHKRWTHLQREYPALFSGVSSRVFAKKTGAGTLYRLQAVGMSDAHARKVCKVLRAKSQACVLIRPKHVTGLAWSPVAAPPF